MESYVNGGKPEPIALFRRDVAARTAGAITESQGGYTIADTSTTAKVGDVYRPVTATNATMVGEEYKVIASTVNSFTIASKDLPTLGDTFYVLAPVTPRYDETGAPQFTLDTSGLATEAKQDVGNTSLASIDTKLSSQATAAKQDSQITQETAINTVLGVQADSVASSDTGTFSIVAFIKRGMQNWTSLLAKLPALVSGRIPVDGSGVTQPISGSVTANAGTNLNTSALALETTQTANGVLIGAVNETAPATDTASSGTNGRLQRIAQRITSLIALIPSALGQGTMAQSFRVVIASDQSAVSTNATLGTETTKVIGVVGNAPSAVSTNALSSAASTAAAASLVVKASAGRLYSFTGYNGRTSEQFIQIHNTTSLPSDAAVPIYSFKVPAQANWSFDFPLGRYFSTGITVCNSSTQATKTVGSSDCWFNAEYL